MELLFLLLGGIAFLLALRNQVEITELRLKVERQIDKKNNGTESGNIPGHSTKRTTKEKKGESKFKNKVTNNEDPYANDYNRWRLGFEILLALGLVALALGFSLSVYLADQHFELLPASGPFLLVVLFAALLGGLGVKFNLKPLVLFSSLFAFPAPLLLPTSPGPALLWSYLVLLNLVSFKLFLSHNWFELLPLSLAGSGIIFNSFFIQGPETLLPGNVFFPLLLIFVGHELTLKIKIVRGQPVLKRYLMHLIFIALLFYLALYPSLSFHKPQLLAPFTFLFSFSYLVWGILSNYLFNLFKSLTDVYLFTALLLLAPGFCHQFTGLTLALILLVGATLLTVLGGLVEQPWITGAGCTYYFGGAFYWLVALLPATPQVYSLRGQLTNRRFLSGLVLALAGLCTGAALRYFFREREWGEVFGSLFLLTGLVFLVLLVPLNFSGIAVPIIAGGLLLIAIFYRGLQHLWL